jgi:stalled ribosome rescue protein Dom34
MNPKNYKRGYPVAVLVGIEQDHAALWHIFSQVAKQQQTIPLDGERKDQKALYSFHETIINALRPVLKEGVRSILVASAPRTTYAQDFLSHVKSHHAWLLQGTNKASISHITGSASSPPQVAALTKTSAFKQLIQENAAEETENLLEVLEKRLSKTDNLVLFSLQEAEKLILNPQAPGKPQPEYLMLTNDYLADSRQKNRVNRLMQIAARNGVKTRVIDAESNAGKRVTQLGGIVCLAKLAKLKETFFL